MLCILGSQGEGTDCPCCPHCGSWVSALGFSVQSDKLELIEITLIEEKGLGLYPDVGALGSMLGQNMGVVGLRGTEEAWGDMGDRFLVCLSEQEGLRAPSSLWKIVPFPASPSPTAQGTCSVHYTEKHLPLRGWQVTARGL